MTLRALFPRPVLAILALTAVTVAPARADCRSVRILEGGLDRLELDLLDIADLVDPGPNQRRIVADAMEYLAPLQCRAVTRLAFEDDDRSEGLAMAWVSSLKPDLMQIAATSNKASERNLTSQRGAEAAYRAGLVTSIVHEATHSAHHLLRWVAPRADWSPGEKALTRQDWSPEALEYAREVVRTNLLDRGLVPEWAALHRRAVELGLANDYHHAGDPSMTEEQILRMGVASAYGGDEVEEDIAEMASGIMAARAWSRYGARAPTPPDDLVCDRMRAEEGPAIPDELALIYAKVGLLHSVGLIGDLEYDYCVGDLAVRAPGNGFYTLRDGRQRNAYAGDVQGRIGTLADGSWVFQMEARGQVGMSGSGEKPARIELTVPLAAAGEPRPSFPRGVYPVGHGGATAAIYYTSEGEEKLGVSVESGMVLVSRASTKLVEGSIFVFRFVNWTSLLPWPEGAGDTVIAFKKRN